MSVAKILAVDDEPDFELLITQRFRRQIREREFDFRFARHGEEALEALAAEPDIDLMLLDINMPVMDGLTLLARLREQRAEVRTIIVSAYGDMQNLRTAMNRGAFDFVTKPVDLNDLEITVRKTIDDISRLRDIDQRREVAERARSNLARYFSPHFAAMLAERDEPLGAQIFACGGSVEKYIGDEIFAVFGVPEPAPEDAANALRCGQMMLAALTQWNREREAAGERSLSIGVGLNYGPAVLGDVGSGQALSFTVVGDTVNTASRLQGLTRTLQTPLIAADAIIRAIDIAPGGDGAWALEQLRDRGEQTLRGRSGAVRIWTQADNA